MTFAPVSKQTKNPTEQQVQSARYHKSFVTFNVFDLWKSLLCFVVLVGKNFLQSVAS